MTGFGALLIGVDKDVCQICVYFIEKFVLIDGKLGLICQVVNSSWRPVLRHSVSTILQNLWTTLVLLLLTLRFGEGITLVGICRNNFLMLKSNLRV